MSSGLLILSAYAPSMPPLLSLPVFMVCGNNDVGSETEEGLCKELQFSLVGNSKLNVVYLLNRRLKHFVSLLEEFKFEGDNTPIVIQPPCYSASKDFQDSPDDEEDAKSSQEYMNDLEEEYQARALLAKFKRFFKKGTQRFSCSKATDQTECHKCGRKAKYNKVKVKLALLSSSSLASNLSLCKNKGLIAETYEWDEEEVSSDENEGNEVKSLMTLTNEERVSVGKQIASHGEWVKISIQKCINEQIPTQKKKFLGIDQLTKDTSSSRPKDLVFVKSSADNSNVSITSSNKTRLSEAKDFTLPNHDTGKVSPDESQRNTTDLPVVVSESLTTDYNSVDESSVCSIPHPPLEKLAGAKPVSGPKTIKSILKSKSTFKAETLKSVIINEPSSAPAKGNISTLVSKTNSAPAGKLKNVKIKDDPPLAIVMKELNELKLQISKNKSSYSRNKNSQQVNQHHTGQGKSSSRSRPSRPTKAFPSCIHCGYNDHLSDDCVYYPTCELCGSNDHDTHSHNMIISLRRGIKPRNPQHVTKNCETCGSNVHTTTDHNDIEWFRKREAFQAKKAETFKISRTESSSALRSKTPTKRWVSKQN
ncbi:hypothetical protein Tco_0066676 [Tanacetum coccineum]